MYISLKSSVVWYFITKAETEKYIIFYTPGVLCDLIEMKMSRHERLFPVFVYMFVFINYVYPKHVSQYCNLINSVKNSDDNCKLHSIILGLLLLWDKKSITNTPLSLGRRMKNLRVYRVNWHRPSSASWHQHQSYFAAMPLKWRHNGRDGVSNHQPHHCLLNGLFRRRLRKTSKLRVTGLCAGNSPGPVNSPHKWPVARKMFPFYGVIIARRIYCFVLLSSSNRKYELLSIV